MKRLIWLWLLVGILAGCAVTTTSTGEEDQGGYPGKWEHATLTTDEFGFEIIVVRQNDERWLLGAKTNCFWARQYVGRSVWLKWGPVESLLMNDKGEVCEFWTKERLD